MFEHICMQQRLSSVNISIRKAFLILVVLIFSFWANVFLQNIDQTSSLNDFLRKKKNLINIEKHENVAQITISYQQQSCISINILSAIIVLMRSDGCEILIQGPYTKFYKTSLCFACLMQDISEILKYCFKYRSKEFGLIICLNMELTSTYYNLMQFRIEMNSNQNGDVKPTKESLKQPKEQTNQQQDYSMKINGTNFFSKLFFTWPFSLTKLNQNAYIKVQNLPNLPDEFKAEHLFEDYKKNTKSYSQMGLFKMLLKVFGCQISKLIILCILTEVFYLSYPILIYYNIDYLQNHRDNKKYGIFLFVMTIAVSFFYNLAYTNVKYLFKVLGINVSSHLNLLIYYKSLKYSLASNKKFAQSDIISYSQIDTDNMMYIGSKLAYFIFGIVEIFTGFALLYWFVGLAFIAGFVVLVLITVITFVISSCNIHLTDQVLQKKDERLTATEQLLNIMRFVKQNAYQKIFFRKIKAWRDQQLRIYKEKGKIEAITVFLYYLTAPLILTSVILTYVYIHGEMSPASVFSTMMIAVIFQVTSQQFPRAISQLLSVVTSIKRIDQFLSVQEIQQKRHSQTDIKEQGRFSIAITNGEFYIKTKTLLETKQKITRTKLPLPKQQKDMHKNRNNRNNRKTSINLNHINVTTDQLLPKKPKNIDQIESSSDSAQDNVVVLKNVNLNIEKGKLYMIFGDIGCGKSSLLLSILNQFNLQKKTSVEINGKISYVSQKPWIFSGSIQSNIEFMHDKNQKKLKQAIKYACLQDDLKLFTNGKDTQIGENGINLSGGQKFRVDLARSLYSNSDIYLYDDILSAVDIHVATFIMENAIKTYLKGKTIVMATHAIKFAEMADYIILLKKGQITACKSYENILRNPDFQELEQKMMQQQMKKSQSSKKIQMQKQIIKVVIQESQYLSDYAQKQDQIVPKVQQEKQIQALMLPQDKEKGEVDFKIFKQYLNFNGGYFCFLFPVIACLISYSAFQTTASILISKWTEQNGMNKNLLYIFISLTISANIFIFIQAIVVTYTGVKQGQNVHSNIIKGLLYATLNRFFNRVPLGRIVSRLSKDLKEMDEVISNTFCSAITTACKILSSLIICIYTSTPYTLIPVAVVTVIFIKLRNFYISSQNQLIRLEKTTNSPLVIGFTNGIRGATLIRSYKREDKFINAYIQNVNNYKRVLLNRYGLMSWFILALVYLTYIINMFSIGFCMFGPDINPSMIGLLLPYILNFNDELFSFVIDQTEFETQLISLERLYKLMNLSPQEKYIKYCKEWNEVQEKSGDIFKSGKIQFRNVSVRYRPDLPKVINSLNVVIENGQKVGVVGRTGSGKSTILNTLLQITQISEGQILIDGKQLTEIALKDLRKSITVIDQQPVLLNSTFRENLDIFNEYTDQELEKIMKQCNIFDIINSRGGLYGKIGNNSLSAGEKQLICICRAVLKKNKIVLIDEATANIDVKNDTLIQKVISQKFADKTVMMIAHRLSSLSNYDKIMVMQGGKLIEYGSPHDLLSKKGVYSQMIRKYNTLIK